MLWDLVKQGDSVYNTTKSKAEDFFGISKEGTSATTTLSSPSHIQFSKKISLMMWLPSGDTVEYIFPVNPEEFNYQRNERIRVTRTLGDPFIDDFGVGLPSLQVRGTTGWRTRPGFAGEDGFGAYQKLHREFFDRFFELRQKQIEMGADPDQIRMWLVNNVDDLVLEVVPMDFRLLRSKSRPLLYQYDLQFTVTKDLTVLSGENSTDLLSQEMNWQDAFRKRFPTLSAIIDNGQSLIDKLDYGYQGVKSALTPVFEAASVFIGGVGAVLEVLNVGAGHVASVINMVADKVDIVTNAVRFTQGVINDFPLPVLIAINNLESAFHELKCYMENGAKDSWLPDFTPIEGVTDCATTRRIATGSIASNPSINAVEWISNLMDAAKNSEVSAVVGFTSQQATASGFSQTSETPVTVDQALGGRINTAIEKAGTLNTFDDIKTVMSHVVEILGSVTFDETKIKNDISENLIQITQTKKIVVNEGDTLQSIAYRELGDANRWHEITTLNNIIVETPVKILHSERKMTITDELIAGDNIVDFGRNIPSGYAEEGDSFLIRDANGQRQWATAKSVSGQTIEFNETFSRFYTAPIELIRYINQANLGIFDYATTLSSAFLTGKKNMAVSQCKDIYPGFVLLIQGQEQSQLFTVDSVNYLQKTVKTKEASTGFPAGADVRIYDTENRQHHLEPGITLDIPVTALNAGLVMQTDRQIYGVDLQLDNQGFLKAIGGDLDIVVGLDNLKQALRHRIRCPYESIIVHPGYGCSLTDIIGERNNKTNIALARATVIDALNKEPRINRILGIEVRSDGDVIGVAAKVESVDKNTSTDLNFVVI